ncbi:MAG: hypothetical protein WB777_23560, partial [Mycobacterium sp.]
TPTKVDSHTDDDHIQFDILGFSRTARRLMDGTAYYPADQHESPTTGNDEKSNRHQASSAADRQMLVTRHGGEAA